jgi:PKD repeat protein
MSSYHNSTRSIFVLFIFYLSTLMVGCGGGGDGTVEQVDEGNVKTIDSSVTIDFSSNENQVPIEVRFSVKSNDLILSALWNFGDGEAVEISPNSPTGPINPTSSVTHTYEEEGTYTVSVVTETNSGGTQSDSIVIVVGAGVSFPVTKVILNNLLPELIITGVVGNSSVGDTDFNFSLIDTVTGDFTLGIGPGERGYIEVRCDVSWQLNLSLADSDGDAAGQDQLGMQLYPCGLDFEWDISEL